MCLFFSVAGISARRSEICQIEFAEFRENSPLHILVNVSKLVKESVCCFGACSYSLICFQNYRLRGLFKNNIYINQS